MTQESRPPDLLSHFWAPLCAIGAHGPGGPNAQICVSVFGASIVPDRPRLLVGVSKTNYTHDLLSQSDTLTVTILGSEQRHLLEPLGLRSARDGQKLDGIEYEVTADGDPFFPGALGYLRCDVLEPFDLGDSTLFLVALRDRQPLGANAALSWADAQRLMGAEFMAAWREKTERERSRAREIMTWRD